MLQIVFFVKKLEIILMKKEDNKTIINQMIQINLKNSYCSKLHHLVKTYYPIKKIDFYHFSDLLIDLENYICKFG